MAGWWPKAVILSSAPLSIVDLLWAEKERGLSLCASSRKKRMWELVDFDWSQRLTLSSDKISTLRRPILLLKLDLVNEEGKREEVTLELDDAELKELVNELGDVNKVLNMLQRQK